MVDKREHPEPGLRKGNGRVDYVTWQPTKRLELFLRACRPYRGDGRTNLSGDDRPARVVDICLHGLWRTDCRQALAAGEFLDR